MSELLVNTIKKADGTGSLSVPAESGTVVTTASPSLGRRNLIINGAGTIAQRSTQVTGVTTSGFRTCDRFRFSLNTLGTWTVDQSTDAPDGFANSFKVTCTTADASPAASDEADINYKIEAQDLQRLNYGSANAEAFTLSFYVKSNKTGTASLTVQQLDNSSKMYSTTYSISSADTWERKTITIAGDASGVINNDNGGGFNINWWLNSGSTYTSGATRNAWTAYADGDQNASNLGVGGATSDYFAITGVQLEVGSVASSYEHRSYGEELALCQRYYINFGGQDFLCTFIDGNTTTRLGTMVQFPVSMRSAPSMSYSTPNVSSSISQGTSTEAYWSVFNSDSANRGAITYIEDVIADAEL